MRRIAIATLVLVSAAALPRALGAEDGVQTRTLELANGMKVLIESDPGLDRSAAALSVNVGSMDNGQVQGIAHFLEHMLFLGTKTYPDPEEYSEYLAQNDGISNAYTAERETNYHFEVKNDAFEGALDRFSRFFIDPLMTDALSSREVNAVDSEHSKNMENEFWRTRQVYRSLLNTAHPHRGFTTGNAETLAGVKNEELRAFYEQHYSANLMELAIVSPFPVEQVEAWVREKFADVPNHEFPAPVVDVPLWDDSLRGHLVEVQSLQDVHELWVRFEMPESVFDWRSKPASILGGILGHEGRESLLQELKQEGLATSLSAGADRVARQGTFSLTLSLTPKGMAQLDTVLERIFGAINMLRALPEIPDYLITERQKMAEIELRFRERSNAMAEARWRASTMHLHPYDNLLPSIYLLPEPSQESLREVLDRLTPENAMVLVYAKDRETDQVEPYYDAGYRVTPLGAERVAKLQAARPAEGVALPPPNPFIPADFDLVEATHAAQPWHHEADYGEVWLRHDTLFEQPKAALEIVLYNDKNSASARDFVLGKLYAGAVQLAMNPYSYPLREAGVNLGISSERRGITLTAGGYSDKLPELTEFALPFLKELRIDETQFGVVKQQYEIGLANFPKQPPSGQAFELFRQLIREVHFTPAQQAEALAPLTYDDLRDYFGRVNDAIRVRAFVYGNMTEEDALRTTDTLVAGLAPSRLIPEAERYRGRVLKLAKGSDTVVRGAIDAQDSIALLLLQGEPVSREDRAALSIVTKVFPTGFYADLRTLQQTGYIVQSFGFEIEGLPFMFAMSQSSVVPTDSLRGRFVAHMAHFLDDLGEMSNEDFTANRDAAIADLAKKSNSFDEELARNTRLAYLYDGDFQDTEKQIAAVAALSRERWIELTRKFLGEDARAVSIQLDGRGERHRYQERTMAELRATAEGWHERGKPDVDQGGPGTEDGEDGK